MRLEKNIINLSIEEATGFHDPVEKHANTSTPVLCTIQPSSWVIFLSPLSPHHNRQGGGRD